MLRAKLLVGVPMIETLLANPNELFAKNLDQIIRFCGDGSLKDGSTASVEFRRVLNAAPDEVLERFATTCLTDGFKDSGFALQDVMNELARRLGFRVEFGRYRGRRGDLSPDGVWYEPSSQFALVVEVKTTDAYRIALDRLSEFRVDTCHRMGIDIDQSSTLVIVGRNDTGEFEAQIRGSRHAWSTRLVSVDALFNVLKLVETVEDDRTIARVCEVLRPREYTRVDRIIDLAFAAAVDVREAEQAEEEHPHRTASDSPSAVLGDEAGSSPVPDVVSGQTRSTPATIAQYRARAIGLVEKYQDRVLVKKSKTIWASESGQVVLVMYSKLHERDQAYWYGYHPKQQERLEAAAQPSFVGLVCGEAGVVVVSATDLHELLASCWRTEREDPSKSYWHIKIRCEDGRPAYFLGNQARHIAPVDTFLPWSSANGS